MYLALAADQRWISTTAFVPFEATSISLHLCFLERWA